MRFSVIGNGVLRPLYESLGLLSKRQQIVPGSSQRYSLMMTVSSAPETSGLASGLLNSTRQIGGTVGVALLGTTMQTLSPGAGLACALGVTIFAFLFAAELSRRTLPGARALRRS